MHENNMKLCQLIEQTCLRYEDKIAFECQNNTVTFTEVEHQSRLFAIWLQHYSGLKAGDRIAIQLPNIIQYPLIAYAALRAGLVIVNTNPLYTTRELVHQLSDSGAKALCVMNSSSLDTEQLQTKTQVNCVVQIAPVSSESFPINLFNFSDTLGAITDEELLISEPSSDPICILQYTGGTTGVAKGASLTHNSVFSNVLQINECLANRLISGQEVVICPLPIYHIYAFVLNLFLVFMYGGRNILIPNPRDIPSIVEAMKPHKVTTFSGINTLFVALCQNEEFKKQDFSQLRLTLSGGAALADNARELWLETTGTSITEGYGMSETSPVIALNQPGDECFGTVGKPLKDTIVEIWDENNCEVDLGVEGEIVVKGPQVMRGYWEKPEETAKVITPDGYFKTGDIGIITDSGEIKIVDRLKDMILVSGFNVYPNEVEQVLCSHPSILESAVVGQTDDKTGESVVAFITSKSVLEESEVIKFCREHLTAYKVPKTINFIDELPKSSVGKVLRRSLR